jgi:hypothetical protein
MSDTRKIVRPSDAISKCGGFQPLGRKPPASDFLPQTKDEIIYLFKRRHQEPRAIAGELTRRSGVLVRVRHINDVLRSAIPDPAPRKPAPVVTMPVRRAA